MQDHEIIETIDQALAEEFELDRSELVPEARFKEDLELDSLDAVDMVIVLEQAFGFKIRDRQAIGDIRTLGDLHGFVIAKKRELSGEAPPEA